jgi:catechol 2,3-dioxygenase-like lactoylglutathione lyase family enzyme
VHQQHLGAGGAVAVEQDPGAADGHESGTLARSGMIRWMATTHLFAGVAVADFAAARAFYERLLGRAPDMLPHATEAAWQLTDTGWLYVVEDAAAAGQGRVTLLVEDLAAEIAALAERGFDAGVVETLGSGARKVELRDPEGNRIGFGQP